MSDDKSTLVFGPFIDNHWVPRVVIYNMTTGERLFATTLDVAVKSGDTIAIEIEKGILTLD